MRNISSKTDNVGDTLPASDFNANLRVELQSIVTDVGLTLDAEGGPDTDLDMFGKALTMYANASQYYVDTGSADTYEIDRVGNLQPLSSYVDGVTVTFKATNSNTGASTLDVDGLGVKDLVDSGGSAISAGVVVAGQYVTARYNSSTDDFELITSAGSSLTTWINLGDDFLPVVSGTGTLGDTTHLVEGLYLGDNNRIYFGDSQDMYLRYNGSVAEMYSNGQMYVGTSDSNNLFFVTNSISRYYLSSSGNLIPWVNNTYNIGNTSNRLANIYSVLGNFSSNVYMDDLFMGGTIYFDQTNDCIINWNDAVSPARLTLDANEIWFATGSAGSFFTRWLINSSGHLLPQTSTGTKDIGSTTYRVRTI